MLILQLDDECSGVVREPRNDAREYALFFIGGVPRAIRFEEFEAPLQCIERTWSVGVLRNLFEDEQLIFDAPVAGLEVLQRLLGPGNFSGRTDRANWNHTYRLTRTGRV